jgi:hypothetical protein
MQEKVGEGRAADYRKSVSNSSAATFAINAVQGIQSWNNRV